MGTCRARLSSAHLQFTPTTIAIAAVSWAFEVGGISWNVTVHKGTPQEAKLPVWEHYRQNGALTPNLTREEVSEASIAGVLLDAMHTMAACLHSFRFDLFLDWLPLRHLPEPSCSCCEFLTRVWQS
jgi:hypothetical protein